MNRESSPALLASTPRSREPSFAFMSRQSAIGGITASDFGADIGVSFRKIIGGDEEALSRLASVTTCDVLDLSKWSPIPCSASRRVMNGHRFPTRTLMASEMRGCPVCLEEDQVASELPPHRVMTYRAHWLIPHVSFCLKHEQDLVPLWQEVQPTLRYDTANRFRELSDDIFTGSIRGETREPTDFEIWFDARLSGETHAPTWLDQHGLHAAATFCRYLGFSLLRLEGVAPTNVAAGSEWGATQMGFDVASNGPNAILEAFAQLNSLAEPRHGPKGVFPVLYDRLAREHVTDPDFAPFRDILAEHLRETWPLGPEDELLGKPVDVRRLHSVSTAAAETGMDARRLRKMLTAANLIDPAMPDAWAVFPVDQAAQILPRIASYVTAKEFGAALHISRSQFNLMVEDGFLRPALEDASTKNVWDLQSGQQMITQVLTGAETLYRALHGWEDVAKAAQRLKIRPAAILQAILDGQIQRVGRNVQFEGYRSIHVVHDEVAQVLAAETAPAMTMEAFAKTVGLGQPVYLGRLVRAGLTPATELRNPKTKALQLYITAEDAAVFHERYVTLRTLSKARQTPWQALAAQLRARGVTTFTPDGADYGPLYLRSEVEMALT